MRGAQEQLLAVDRLGEEVVGARLQAAVAIDLLASAVIRITGR